MHSGPHTLLQEPASKLSATPDCFVHGNSSCLIDLPRSTCLPRSGLSSSHIISMWLSVQQAATLVPSTAIPFIQQCIIAHVYPEALFGPLYVLIYSFTNVYSFFNSCLKPISKIDSSAQASTQPRLIHLCNHPSIHPPVNPRTYPNTELPPGSSHHSSAAPQSPYLSPGQAGSWGRVRWRSSSSACQRRPGGRPSWPPVLRARWCA